MKLKKIGVQNFRSIKECTINVDTICALVGENNSGKSAILRALNSFFNFEEEKDAFKLGIHQYSPKSYVRIELTFIDVPDKDIYRDKLVNEELIIRMTYSHTTNKRTLHYRKTGYHEIGLDFMDYLKEDIHFIFIPPNRDHTQFTWSENALLKKVLEEYLKQRTEKKDLLTPKVRDAAENLQKQAFSKIAKELRKHYSLSHKFNFNIRYSSDIDYSMLLKDIFLEISDHGKQFSVTDCGSGIQSLTIIALYRYLAHLKHNNFILGIEEPETNLHPQAQRELIKTLRDKNGEFNEIQIVFTTHSAVIVDQLEHEEIVLFRNVPEVSRGFKTVGHQIPRDF